MEEHVTVLDRTVSLLRSLGDNGNVGTDDKETLDNLSSAFSDVLSTMQQCCSMKSMSPTTVAKNALPKLKSGEPGRPAFDISSELLEDLLGLGFSHTKISEMFHLHDFDIYFQPSQELSLKILADQSQRQSHRASLLLK